MSGRGSQCWKEEGGRIRRYQSCKIYIGPQLLQLSCNRGIGGVRVGWGQGVGGVPGIRRQWIGVWMGLRGRGRGSRVPAAAPGATLFV